MGYRHTDNLYANTTILNFPECYATEKIHGTSANIVFNLADDSPSCVQFHSGGEKHENFVKLFDATQLWQRMRSIALFDSGNPNAGKVTVFGEAYGGKQQKQAWRYGPNLKFCAFEVLCGDTWLTVPRAHQVAAALDLEFVHYVRIPCNLAAIDAERDATSEQAIRNGVTTRDGEHIRREGVVLRTINEERDGRGNRIIAKHKRAEERETKTERVVDTTKMEKLQEAKAIADEYVVSTRLEHVLNKLGEVKDMTRTREVIAAMIEDVNREGAGEFEPSNQVNAEIGKRTAYLLKRHLESNISDV